MHLLQPKTKLSSSRLVIVARYMYRMNKRGVISHIGPTKFRDVYWIVVAYDEPFGKHDGSVDGE
ncbi:unnamed protein product, partial [Onchocerca ochengi]|uniref:CAP-Gly domain-containing protein n=1 Tax=Onchocerca ochengi TaxID=42157 RepID=A0A182EYA9_ONCOC